MQVGPRRIVYVTVPVAPQIIYVRRPSSGSSVSVADGENYEKLRQKIEQLKKSEKNGDRARKLEKLEGLISQIFGIANHISAPGIASMLMSQLQSLEAQVASGDIDGALTHATDVLDNAKYCQDLVTKIKEMLTALQFDLGLSGPAKRMMGAVIEMGKAALNSATSPGALRLILGFLEEALEVGKQLRGLSPGSSDYERGMRKLAAILGALAGLVGPAIHKDHNDIKDTLGGLVGEGLDKLRGQTRDAIKLQQLDQLDNALGDIIAQGADLRGKARLALREQVTALLAQAGAGDVGGAAGAAGALREKVDQLVKLQGHLDGNMDRLQAAADKLTGPGAEVMKNVMAKLQALQENAATPEAMLALDAEMVKALQLADKLGAKGGASGGIRSPEYVALLQLDRKLGAQLPAAPDPCLGKDDYQRAKTGTAPLDQGKGTGRMDPAAQSARSLATIERCAAAVQAGGEADVAAALLAMGARAKAAIAKAGQDAIELAATSLELEGCRKLAEECEQASPGSKEIEELAKKCKEQFKDVKAAPPPKKPHGHHPHHHPHEKKPVPGTKPLGQAGQVQKPTLPPPPKVAQRQEIEKAAAAIEKAASDAPPALQKAMLALCDSLRHGVKEAKDLTPLAQLAAQGAAACKGHEDAPDERKAQLTVELMELTKKAEQVAKAPQQAEKAAASQQA